MPEHLSQIEAAGGRAIFGPMPFREGFAQVCEGESWSAFDESGILGCGGIYLEHETCGTAWSLLLPASGNHMTALTRFSRGVFDASPLVRIQAHASPTFAPASRWLELMGFEFEGTLRKFSPSGSDMRLYARVRN